MIETKFPKGKIVEIKELPDGAWLVKQKIEEPMQIQCDHCHTFVGNEKKSNVSDDIFILIEAEALSMKDKFMQYKPRTEKEKVTKKLIAKAIRRKVKNFYRPKYDPSFTEYGSGIQFVPGKEPAVSESSRRWEELARKYSPERNSRLGTKLEYAAFLGVLIKKLVEEGKSVEWAWDAVCNDSRKLGDYCIPRSKRQPYEPTGSNCICGFYDLANAYKFLAEDIYSDGSTCWLASSCFQFRSEGFSVAKLSYKPYGESIGNYGVGWIVLEV